MVAHKDDTNTRSCENDRKVKESLAFMGASTPTQNKGFRRDYTLGETIRHSSHKIIHSTPDKAVRAVESLQNQDFAFIKRSDGTYCYAILAQRTRISTERNKGDSDEIMVFVVNESGSTKLLRKSRWRDSVCLVSE